VARQASKSAPSPAVIAQDLIGAWRTRALVTAIDLEIFDHIDSGKNTVAKIAAAAKASQRGVTNLLDALVGIGYLRKRGSRYLLEPVTAKYLLKNGKIYMGSATQTISLNWDVWRHLTESVKSGQPHEAFDEGETGKNFFLNLVSGIFPRNFASSGAVVSQLSGEQLNQIRTILDVAAGSGAWSLAFAQAIPSARVTSMDLPEMTAVTRSFAENFGVADRYAYLEGDLRNVDFGREAYDLVILGHIIHSEGERRGKDLIRKSYRALRPGGMLLIAEFIPNDARTGPPMPVLFGLNMLLHTDR